MGGRKLKKEVLRLLRHNDFKKSIVEISGFSARQVVNRVFCQAGSKPAFFFLL